MITVLILLMREMKYRGARRSLARRSEPGLSPGLPAPRFRHLSLALCNILGGPQPTLLCTPCSTLAQPVSTGIYGHESGWLRAGELDRIVERQLAFGGSGP